MSGGVNFLHRKPPARLAPQEAAGRSDEVLACIALQAGAGKADLGLQAGDGGVQEIDVTSSAELLKAGNSLLVLAGTLRDLLVDGDALLTGVGHLQLRLEDAAVGSADLRRSGLARCEAILSGHMNLAEHRQALHLELVDLILPRGGQPRAGAQSAGAIAGRTATKEQPGRHNGRGGNHAHGALTHLENHNSRRRFSKGSVDVVGAPGGSRIEGWGA